MLKLVPSSPVCNWVLAALVKAHQGHSWADPWVSQESGEPGTVSSEPCFAPCSAQGLVLAAGTGQSQGEVLGTRVVTARPLNPAWGWAAEDRWPVLMLVCLALLTAMKCFCVSREVWASPSCELEGSGCRWRMGMQASPSQGRAPLHRAIMVLLLPWNKHSNSQVSCRGVGAVPCA